LTLTFPLGALTLILVSFETSSSSA